MLPLSDGIPARRFPIVTIAIIAANFAVWLLYELPHLDSSVAHASFYACSFNGSCDAPEPWEISWLTVDVLARSWDHILGNYALPRGLRQERGGRARPPSLLAFDLAGGFVATIAQTAMTLLAGTAADALVPNLGASGAIAAVLGAYFVFYPHSRVLGSDRRLPGPLSAWFFLGFWFLYQLYEANVGAASAPRRTAAASPSSHTSAGSCSALIVAWLFVSSGRFQDARTPVGARI